MTEKVETPEDLELFHYGILGMKWGVRRPVGPDGLVSSGGRTKTKSKSSSEPQSKDSKKAGKLKSRSLSSLSNKELQELNTRLNLEQNYSNLTRQPSKLQKGIKYTQTGLTVVGLATAAYKLKDNELVKAVKKHAFK